MRAIMVVAAAALTLMATACTSSSEPPPAPSSPAVPTIRVSCSSPDGTPVAGDRPTLRSRATRLGARAVAVRSAGPTIQIDVRGLAAQRARELCASPTVQLRGLIAPAVKVTCAAGSCAAHSVSDALRAAHLDPPPLTEASYTALSAAQQHAIATALAGFDCSSAADEKNDPASYFVACGSGNAYYLGPVVVSGAEIAQAAAAGPDQFGRAWRVNLDLTRAGATAWAQYTSAHNTNTMPPTADVISCGPETTPCATWVAFVMDGDVVSIPYNNQAITSGATEISGSFDRAEAKRLAVLLDSALPVALQVDSVQVVR